MAFLLCTDLEFPACYDLTHQVPQCGYCQSGMQMAVASLLAANPSPTDDEIDAAVTNICRCGTYDRIRAAIHQAAQDS